MQRKETERPDVGIPSRIGNPMLKRILSKNDVGNEQMA
jgi:hypothetical protein